MFKRLGIFVCAAAVGLVTMVGAPMTASAAICAYEDDRGHCFSNWVTNAGSCSNFVGRYSYGSPKYKACFWYMRWPYGRRETYYVRSDGAVVFAGYAHIH